jgi:hypothetical protein
MTDSEDDSAAEVEADMRSLREAVASRPFPALRTIRARMRSLLSDVGHLYSVHYGEVEHDWARRLYESAFDNAVCAAVGHAAGQKGGVDCMRAVYYAAVQFSPLCDGCPENHALAGNVLSTQWDGLWGWQH